MYSIVMFLHYHNSNNLLNALEYYSVIGEKSCTHYFIDILLKIFPNISKFYVSAGFSGSLMYYTRSYTIHIRFYNDKKVFSFRELLTIP